MLCSSYPPVAQLVEREAYTFVVLGSSPSGRTQEILVTYTFVVLGSSLSGPTILKTTRLI